MINYSVGRARNSLLCVFFLLIVFLPAELYVDLEGVRLEPYRVFLMLAFFALLPRMLRHKYSKGEVALLAYTVWVMLSMIYNHAGQGVESGGVHFLEVFVSYFIGLSVAGNSVLLRKNVNIMLGVFLLLLPFAVVEAMDGYRLFHVMAGEFSGMPYSDYLGDKYFRYELHRASTVFAHPILYAVIGVMFLALLPVLFGVVRSVLYFLGILGAAITSVSSVAFIMLAWTVFMYVLKYLSAGFRSIYKLVFSGALLIYILLSIASDRGPVLLLISVFSLNQDTAYTRYLQWVFAADDIAAHPIMGIGISEWSRPFWLGASVDSHWLLVVLRHGYPAVILLGMFFWSSLAAFWRDYKLRNSALSFAFFVSVSSFVVAAFTVTYFDRAHMMLYLVMGFYNSFVGREAGAGYARKD